MGVHVSTAIMEVITEATQKIINGIISDPALPFLGKYIKMYFLLEKTCIYMLIADLPMVTIK